MHRKPSYIAKHPRLPVVQWIKKLQAAGKQYLVAVLEETIDQQALPEADLVPAFPATDRSAVGIDRSDAGANQDVFEGHGVAR